MRFSESSGHVLEAASREARHLGHPAVGTGHMLRALLADEACTASGLLRVAGVETTRLLASLGSQAHDLANEGSVVTTEVPEGAVDERHLEGLVRSGKVVRLAPDLDRLPQTAALKRAIERAIEEARRLGPSRLPLLGGGGVADVGTEHLLLGLLAGHEGAARKVLERAGVDAVRVREQLRRGSG